ncbi:CotH kinase family protein [Owenweeksia hongkongensis]|uniref:CotH kinase family protein n=1 Tax=Owenweeksia hongkongensis TaxID=253245 RepID=UPI003A8D49B6
MKFRIFLALMVLAFANVSAQSLYDLNTVQEIEITFAQSNWDALLDTEKAGNDGYIMAQSVSINGVVFDSVGVKYKGNSTYNANQTKNPFHIELDTYKDHIYEAYTDIKLSNAYNDPSFVREVLSYQILRQYTDAPLSNYANVKVNGTLIGLYSSSESISKKFLTSRFASKTNTFVKCNPIDGAGPGTSDYPNLVYLGQDSSLYYNAYEMKSDAGWKDLINFCDSLSNNIADIENILDVDRALWMLAFNNVLVNLDSYSGEFTQNYYLYKDDYGRFLPIVWDLNESFGRFSQTGSGTLNSTAQKQQMTHLLHLNDSDYPLIQKLLNVPMYKRMYLAHIKTMLEETFNNGSYYSTAQNLQSVIDASVQADPNKFYTYANFTSNLTSDVTSGGGPMANSAPGVTNLMDARSTYLLAQSDFTQTQPSISSIATSIAAPTLGQTVTITANIANATTVYLNHRSIEGAPFTRTQMYDDGAHNDGSAGDGVYGTDLKLNSSTTQYYIYAENSNIGKFSPERAQHEFYSIYAVGKLVINEFMADNDGVIADQNGDYNDWIEIYNNSSDSILLGDYYLTDDANDPTQYRMPNEYLAAGGFKLIWASGDTTVGSNHADFKLSKSGEQIVLFYDNGTDLDTADFIVFSTQTTDESYGRSYDASPTWIFFTASTPEASNGTLGVEEIKHTGLQLYPNPYQGQVTIENPTESKATVTVYSAVGQVLQTLEIGRFETMVWQDSFPVGMRIISLETENAVEVIRLISK